MSLKRLEGIIGLIPSKASNPILTYLYVEAREGRLWVRGGNGDVEASGPITGLEVEGEGTFLLPKALAEYLPRARRLVVEADAVALELQGGGLIRGQIAPTDGYPEPLDVPADWEVELPKAALEALAELPRFASREDYRAIFRGIQVEVHPGRIRAVASDGYRLSLMDVPMSHNAPEGRIVLPRLNLEPALRLLRGEEARLSFTRGHARFRAEDLEVGLTLMEGEFPNYERVIPKEAPFRLLVTRESALSVLDEALRMTDSQNRRVDLVYDGAHWHLEAEGPYGTGRWPFPARLIEGMPEPGSSWAFNARHLREGIAFLQTPEVDGRLQDPKAYAATLWQGEWQGVKGLAIVVPLRT